MCKYFFKCVCRLYFAVYTVRTCEFQQMWYKMFQADYCFKHFKLELQISLDRIEGRWKKNEMKREIIYVRLVMREGRGKQKKKSKTGEKERKVKEFSKDN